MATFLIARGVARKPAEKASEGLAALGFEIGRLKTGTRLELTAARSTLLVWRCSPATIHRALFLAVERIEEEQIPCWITYTNAGTHELIEENLNRSAMYSGRIEGIGPRYCPSIEDKVVRFADKDRHQIFVEPEGRKTLEYYINGLSMSLPEELQTEIVRSLPGLEKAEIMRPAYAVEYDYAPPTQLYPHLETASRKPLFCRANHSTAGYEEAGAQEIMAGINAVLKVRGEAPFAESLRCLSASSSMTWSPKERKSPTVFSLHAQSTALLREDNADYRLMERAREFG